MIRLGTRSSPLALAQANAMATRLRDLGATVELVPMRTEGDRLVEKRLADIGGKGLFVRDIEQALLRKEIDIAVHSLKDLPAEVPAGLTMAAYPEREDPRDVLVTRQGGGVAALGQGAVVGTSSPRRRAMLLAVRPDLRIEPVRGNVDTRLRKLDSEGWDAIVLAAAGIRRLGLALEHAEPLDPEVFVPAVGQGIIGIEARDDDAETLGWLGRLDDPTSRSCASAERAYLARLGASCVTPMGAYARLDRGTLHVTGVVASEDGRQVLRASTSGDPARATELGRTLADTLLERGAASVVALRPEAGR
ncbi:MAG: hydroxymethylbilane synthase [Candidatus Rokubacteria bacterium]|nr:hydroxymethylbilane synthase [Candidatus Rokubacteria bacterium]